MQVGRYPNRGTQHMYRVPTHLSRPVAPSLEEQELARIHDALLTHDAAETQRVVLIRSGANPCGCQATIAQSAAPAPIGGMSHPQPSTPLVNHITCRQSRMSVATGTSVAKPGERRTTKSLGTRAAASVVPDEAAPAVAVAEDPEAILARCEHALAEASESVQLARRVTKPSREQVEAAAAQVAEAKSAFATMREEISQSLREVQRQMEADMQTGLAQLAACSQPSPGGETHSPKAAATL